MSETTPTRSLAKGLDTAAHGISYVLHPFLLPVYVSTLLLLSQSTMHILTPLQRWFFIGSVAINTIVIPGLFIWLLRLTGILRNLSLTTQRERIYPLIVVAICYIFSITLVAKLSLAFLLRKFLSAALACVIMALAVTPIWKISLHMIGMGGVTAMLLLLNITGYAGMFTPLCIAIMLSGMLASARLWLGYHTPAQVAAGYFGGMLLSAAVILFM